MSNNDDHTTAWLIGSVVGYKLGQHWANRQMEREERRQEEQERYAREQAREYEEMSSGHWERPRLMSAAEARRRELERLERQEMERLERQENARLGITDEEAKIINIVSIILTVVVGVALFVGGGAFLLHILICAITGTPF